MADTDSARRWVATLIVLLLLAQAAAWGWRKVRQARQRSAQQATEAALRRKIAASMAYDTALLRADSLLAAANTAAAARLLDSLRQQPTDSLFPIERQKLRQLQARLDAAQARRGE
jgi:hypothetical protein